MKPICVPCSRFFRPKKTGLYFTEGMPKPGVSNSDIVGTRSPGSWQPYKLWAGDLWECPDCGAEVVTGVPPRAIAEHYQPEFADQVRSFDAGGFQVNDC